jgi:hypothetical protein
LAGLGSLDAYGPFILNHHGLRPGRLLDACRPSAGNLRLSQELTRKNFTPRNLSAGILSAGILSAGILSAGIFSAGILSAGILSE